MRLPDFIEKGPQLFLPQLSIDAVVIGYEQGVLKCLLLRIGEKWVLPGGYIGQKESVEGAAGRILRERTGLQAPHLNFLAVFGGQDRQFAEEFRYFFESRGLDWKEGHWMGERFVSLGYFSLVDIQQTTPVAGLFDEEIGWFDLDDLPPMWLDHRHIATKARISLQEIPHLEYLSPNLLPSPFTMPQLHKLHQLIRRKELDRSRFQKKMLATDLFERLPQKKQESRGRSPFQYRLKASKS